MTASSTSGDIEVMVDVETIGPESRRKKENYSYCASQVNYHEQKLHKTTDSVGPPEYFTVDDDSDEEITFLGTFNSSVLPRDSQSSSVKEEGITTIQQQVMSLRNSISNSCEKMPQNIIPTEGVSLVCLNNTTVSKQNSSSSPTLIEKESIGEVILNRQEKCTSHASLCDTASKRALEKSDFNAFLGEHARTTLSNTQEWQRHPSHTDSVVFPSPELGTHSNTEGPVLSENSTNVCTDMSPLQEKRPKFAFSSANVSIKSKGFNGDNGGNTLSNTQEWQRHPSQTDSEVFPSPELGIHPNIEGSENSTTVCPDVGLLQEKGPNFPKVKQKIRYVSLPAKFPNLISNYPGKTMIKLVNSSVVSQQPPNLNVINTDLPVLVRNRTPTSVGSKPPDIRGPINSSSVQGIGIRPAVASTKLVFFKPNTNDKTGYNTVDSLKPGLLRLPPPAKLVIENVNKVVHLKKIKEPKPQTNQPPVSVEKLKTDQSCQTDGSPKGVDQACQTSVYSWVYKNSKLYNFVDGKGTQVELVPVEQIRMPSPVSSLDYESDTGSDDEARPTENGKTSVMDALRISNNVRECGTSTNDIPGPEALINNLPYNPPSAYQPKNTFKEVLYTDLGLCSSSSRAMGNTQIDSFGNQNVFPNNTITSEVNTNCVNTVYGNEFREYMPYQHREVQNEVVQPTVSNSNEVVRPTVANSNEVVRPIVANNNDQVFAANTNLIVDKFTKLVEDIRTCLHIDALGNIPLHQAAIDGDLVKLKSQCIVLKTIGSNLDHLNLNHETALMLAVKVAVETENYEAVSILIAEGADQRIVDQDGNTPLHYAVIHGCEPIVRILLTVEYADEVNERFNYDGLTPLHSAAMEGNDNILRLLISTSIDINVKDRKNGRTPYFIAVREKKKTSAELLRMCGADVHEVNFADQTPQQASTPEKISLPLPTNEQKFDVPDNELPHQGRIKLSLLQTHKLIDSSLSLPRAGNQSFVFKDVSGLKPLAPVSKEDKVVKKISERKNVSEAFDVKELYNKYVIIQENKQSDHLLKETRNPFNIISKKIKLINPAHQGNVQVQSKTALSSYVNKLNPTNLIKQSAMLQNTSTNRNVESAVENMKHNHESVSGASSNNAKPSSTSQNISEARKFESPILGENNENNPNSPCNVDKGKNHETVLGVSSNNPKQSLTSHNISGPQNVESSVLVENIENHPKSPCNFEKSDNQILYCEFEGNNTNSQEKMSGKIELTVNPNSEIQPNKDAQKNISLNPSTNLTLGKEYDGILRRSHSTEESKQCSQLSNGILNSVNENNSANIDQPEKSAKLSSSICITDKQNIRSNTLDKNVGSHLLSDGVYLNSEVNNSEETKQVVNQSHTDFHNEHDNKAPSSPQLALKENSTERSECNSAQKNISLNPSTNLTLGKEYDGILRSHSTEESKQCSQLSNGILNSVSENNSVNIDQLEKSAKLPSSICITDKQNIRSNTLEKNVGSHLLSDGVYLNSEVNNSEETKQVVNQSHTDFLHEHDNKAPSSPQLALKEKSTERSECNSEMNEDCGSKTIVSEEFSTTQVFSSEGQSVENVLADSVNPESTSCGFSVVAIDIGSDNDVIIGNDRFLSDSNDPNNTISENLLTEAEIENIQLPSGTPVNSISTNKTENDVSSHGKVPKRNCPRKRKHESNLLLTNQKNKKQRKRVVPKKKSQKESIDCLAPEKEGGQNKFCTPISMFNNLSKPLKTYGRQRNVSRESNEDPAVHNKEVKLLSAPHAVEAKQQGNVLSSFEANFTKSSNTNLNTLKTCGMKRTHNTNREPNAPAINTKVIKIVSGPNAKKNLVFLVPKTQVVGNPTFAVHNTTKKLPLLICKPQPKGYKTVSNQSLLKESVRNYPQAIDGSFSTITKSDCTEKLNDSTTASVSKSCNTQLLVSDVSSQFLKITQNPPRKIVKTSSIDTESKLMKPIRDSVTTFISELPNAQKKDRKDSSQSQETQGNPPRISKPLSTDSELNLKKQISGYMTPSVSKDNSNILCQSKETEINSLRITKSLSRDSKSCNTELQKKNEVSSQTRKSKRSTSRSSKALPTGSESNLTKQTSGSTIASVSKSSKTKLPSECKETQRNLQRISNSETQGNSTVSRQSSGERGHNPQRKFSKSSSTDSRSNCTDKISGSTTTSVAKSTDTQLQGNSNISSQRQETAQSLPIIRKAKSLVVKPVNFISTDTESNFTIKISSNVASTSEPSNTHSQGSGRIPLKRSLDSVEQVLRESEKKSTGSIKYPVIAIEKYEGTLQLQDSPPRRSTRAKKKKLIT